MKKRNKDLLDENWTKETSFLSNDISIENHKNKKVSYFQIKNSNIDFENLLKYDSENEESIESDNESISKYTNLDDTEQYYIKIEDIKDELFEEEYVSE